MHSRIFSLQQSMFTSGKHQNLWCSGLACPRAYGNAGSREALGTRMLRTLHQPRSQPRFPRFPPVEEKPWSELVT
jgi:hypothetical protein